MHFTQGTPYNKSSWCDVHCTFVRIYTQISACFDIVCGAPAYSHSVKDVIASLICSLNFL